MGICCRDTVRKYAKDEAREEKFLFQSMLSLMMKKRIAFRSTFDESERRKRFLKVTTTRAREEIT